MNLSIVSTLYCSESNLKEFYNRATNEAFALAENSYEIILVNDGSPDESLALALEISKKDTHVKIIDLSRNFGHYKALMTGLKYASGEKIFLIDSDLEEQPEYLSLFNQRLEEGRCDVIFGVQAKRKGGLFEKVTGEIFWRMFNFFSDMNLPLNTITARLMTKQYVAALLLHQEKEIFIAGLWHITGFNQQAVQVTKKNLSKTSYTFLMKISLLVNAITSFSNAPLRLIFYIGSAILLLSSAYISYLIVMWAYFLEPPSGWTSLMASIWLLGGLIILFLGIIGIYLSKIFLETKNRPLVIIKSEHGFAPPKEKE